MGRILTVNPNHAHISHIECEQFYICQIWRLSQHFKNQPQMALVFIFLQNAQKTIEINFIAYDIGYIGISIQKCKTHVHQISSNIISETKLSIYNYINSQKFSFSVQEAIHFGQNSQSYHIYGHTSLYPY